MDFSTLPSLSGEALTEALALDFKPLDEAALTAALTERKAEVTRIFALEAPSIAEVDAVEAIVASIKDIETEQAKREADAKDAATRLAAAKVKFSDDGGDDLDGADGAADGADDADGDDADGDDADGGDADADAEVEAAADADAEVEAAADDKEEVVTAAADQTRSGKVKGGAAAAVGRRTKRPAVKATQSVTITAAAEIPNVAVGSELDGMDAVSKALLARAKGFPKFSPQASKSIRSANGGVSKIEHAAIASFGLDFPTSLTASGTPGAEHLTVKEAIEQHQKALVAAMAKGETLSAAALTAAGWCAPSPIAYSYIADYVVDGLITVPEVNAPRGGLMVTTGPARASQGTALDDFGWTQTEAEAEARTPKTFEGIVCPDFVDHRLDAVGYGFTIPLLTQKAYPELVTDALKFASVLYAHRTNRRIITDIVALSQAVTYSGYGPTFTDSLEVLSLIATAERRKWNLGVNALMEVKLPVVAKEIFRADMSRRAAVAFDSVSDGQIAKHFSDRHLAVEYVADWQEIGHPNGGTLTNLVLQGTFTALIYPAGTFVKAVEDVINLSATYDAASLTVNEYQGVFFEQGLMVFKAGYGSSKVSIPINTSGTMGALLLNGSGDELAGGSF